MRQKYELNEPMERRSLLKKVGGIGAIAAVGGAGLLATSGGALAANSSLSITGSSVTNDDGDLTEVIVNLDHEATWDGFDEAVDAVEYRDVIKRVDGSGNVVASHVLRDELDDPVPLSDIADGSWGGSDENATGPGTEGKVVAGIQWSVLHDEPSNATYIPPGDSGSVGDVQNFGMDNTEDDSTKTCTLKLTKKVQFYAQDPNGSYTGYQNNNTYRLMGGDDGTLSETVAEGTFAVDVTNEAATAGSSGSGSSDAS